jgi:hypothetical protein
MVLVYKKITYQAAKAEDKKIEGDDWYENK